MMAEHHSSVAHGRPAAAASAAAGAATGAGTWASGSGGSAAAITAADRHGAQAGGTARRSFSTFDVEPPSNVLGGSGGGGGSYGGLAVVGPPQSATDGSGGAGEHDGPGGGGGGGGGQLSPLRSIARLERLCLCCSLADVCAYAFFYAKVLRGDGIIGTYERERGLLSLRVLEGAGLVLLLVSDLGAGRGDLVSHL